MGHIVQRGCARATMPGAARTLGATQARPAAIVRAGHTLVFCRELDWLSEDCESVPEVKAVELSPPHWWE